MALWVASWFAQYDIVWKLTGAFTTPRPTTYDGKFFRNGTTRQAIFVFSRIDPLCGIRQEKEREHLSYFVRFIRHTANNLRREAVASELGSAENVLFLFSFYPGTRTISVIPATRKQKEENHCFFFFFQRLYKSTRDLRPIKMENASSVSEKNIGQVSSVIQYFVKLFQWFTFTYFIDAKIHLPLLLYILSLIHVNICVYARIFKIYHALNT